MSARRELSRYRPFTSEEIVRAQRLLDPFVTPWRWLTQPLFLGLEHLPTDRPALFIGNHTLLGFLDAPLMLLELLKRRGILLRGLGDHAHFTLPGWGDYWSQVGFIDGTRENCARAMSQGENLLAFPGGAREVFKRKNEQYRLLWGSRRGFARMAIAYGYPIVPFAAVGAEECYDIVYDRDDLAKTPLGSLARRWIPRQEMLLPVLRGLGPTPLPRPQRLYFKFSEPIETARFNGQWEDETPCRTLTGEVKERIEGDIAALLALRESDPQRDGITRLTSALNGTMTRGGEPIATGAMAGRH